MKRSFIGGLVAALMMSPALADPIPLVPSTSQYSEASQIVPTINYALGLVGNALPDMVVGLSAPFTTTGTSANTVATYVVPASSFNAGQAYRIKGWGVNSADANAKTLTINFGTSAPTLVVTGSGNTWQFEAIVQNVGTVASPSQNIAVSGSTATTLVALTNTNSTQALTAALTLNVQMTAATAGTMTMNGLTIEALR